MGSLNQLSRTLINACPTRDLIKKNEHLFLGRSACRRCPLLRECLLSRDIRTTSSRGGWTETKTLNASKMLEVQDEAYRIMSDHYSSEQSGISQEGAE